ncbi:MAG: tolC 1 [Firmicutes bacterium]|nr:tolC 1 [Bacillota bacterium]
MMKLLANIIKMSAMLCALVSIVQTAAANPLELTLEDSIIMATKNNHAIKIAQAEKEQSRWSLEQAKAGKGFKLSVILILVSEIFAKGAIKSEEKATNN